MGGAGALAMEQLRAAERGELGDFLLLLDGAIPTGKTAAMTTVGLLDGKELSSLDLAVRLNDASVATLAVGTCASFGGIPSARPRPTGAVDLRTALGDDTIIRVPGCPPHPDWILTTAIAAAAGRMVDLDELGRPRAIFRKTVHDECPRRPYFDRSDFASVPGDQTRCFFEVGCKGPFTNADCPTRLWHEGRTCCIAANHPCIGCAAPGFIDRKEGGADYPISPIYA
jgi:hydrogenase small subunit